MHHHDLQTLLSEVLTTSFGGLRGRRLDIRWASVRRPERAFWAKTWAYYCRSRIRIHPGLDSPWVPEYFLRWLIGHEVLHGIVRSRRIGGVLWDHPPEFRAIERTLPDYDRATEWETHNLNWLHEHCSLPHT